VPAASPHATDVFQHTRLNRIIAAIHHHIKAILTSVSRLSGFPAYSGTRFFIAQHFQFAQLVTTQ
jgi:hypothetical protein